MKYPSNSPARRRSLGIAAAVGLALSLGACNAMDDLADKFEKVSIGDTRAAVIQTMGQPASANTLEVPLVRLDSITWKAPMSGKVYLVLLTLDHVVAKTAIQ